MIDYISKEVWKPVQDYDDYLVSNLGRIYDIKLKRMLKPERTKKGYLRVDLYPSGKPRAKNCKHFKVHRIVAQAFIPNPENYPEIDHNDLNKSNNEVSNLE